MLKKVPRYFVWVDFLFFEPLIFPDLFDYADLLEKFIQHHHCISKVQNQSLTKRELFFRVYSCSFVVD